MVRIASVMPDMQLEETCKPSLNVQRPARSDASMDKKAPGDHDTVKVGNALHESTDYTGDKEKKYRWNAA